MDKKPWLALREVEAAWPVQGKPRQVGVDNASEFHSQAFERGCARHGIAIDWRPPGRPHFGGVGWRLPGSEPGRVRPRSLLIVGPTNNGKTAIAGRFRSFLPSWRRCRWSR